MPRRTATKSPARSQANTGVFLIGLFKLFKALLLVIVGIGAHKLLKKDLTATINHWVEVLRVDPDNQYIHRLLARLFSVTPKQLKELSVGTFFYAALLTTEGIGLMMRKRWAEYFTVISTGLFIPLELYEIAMHFTMLKLGVLALNVAIVWYLIVQLRSRKHR